MVTASENTPDPVLEGDVEKYIQLAQPGPATRQKLRQADPDDKVRLLARGWFHNFHGEEREAKKLFVLLMNEEGIPFTGADIQAITGRPPVDTQT